VEVIKEEIYTYPGEEGSLKAAIAILTFVLIFVFAITMGVAFYLFIFGIIAIKITQSHLLGNCVLVNQYNYSEINQVINKACQTLGLERPRVHIKQDPYLNAFAIGFTRPYSVVLNSALTKEFNSGEITFVIGHELAHIKRKHCFWLSLIAPFGKTIPGFEVIFGIWQRKAEYTCDRAGLLVCGNPNHALAALIKLSCGQDALKHINLKSFIKQIIEMDMNQLERSAEFFSTHPYMVNRIKELLAFSIKNNLYVPKDKTKICTSCNRVYEDQDLSFCTTCGTPLEASKEETPLQCLNCSRLLETEMKYCPYCGTEQKKGRW
jgi:Zn-dependent protease with chaperone function/RNA polymerase subunit RPABC4/transcription elongation factor Spt4